MADISKALPVVLHHEVSPITGPYSNHPNDHGGPTCYGITLAEYQLYKPGATVEDLKHIPMSDVQTIYRANYWMVLGLDDILSQMVATKVFDICVNAGPGQATLLAQRACITCGQKVEADGHMGPITRSAINKCDPTKFVVALKQGQANFYNAIVQHDPTQKVFLKGWLSRADWPVQVIDQGPDMLA